MNLSTAISCRLGKVFIILLTLICFTGSLAGCSEPKQNNSEQIAPLAKSDKSLRLLEDQELVPLDVPVDSYNALYCRWSPDGQWLVYGNNGDLFLYNYKTGEHVNLTNTPDRWELMPAWSPDGKMLCFTSRRLEAAEEHIDSEGTMVMSGAWGGSPSIIERDGSEYEILEEGTVTDPGWSLDGKTIVYGCEGNIHLFDLKEHKARILTPDEMGLQAQYIGSPAWSSTRSEIAFFFSRSKQETTHQEVVDGNAVMVDQGYGLLDLQTNKVKPLYTFKGFYTSARIPALWSSDGNQLAFNLKQETFISGPGLIVSSRQGDRVKKIGEGYQVIWEPDGKRLVYIESSDHERVTLVNFEEDTYTKDAIINKVPGIQGLTWRTKR